MEEGVNGVRACVICPGEVDTPLLAKRPVPQPAEVRAKMLRPEDLGRTIRFVSEMPTHVCVNEIIISPVSNRLFLS
jgi:NADP-dependent 3-hydroxy acid dehydrogenase YdfG